MSILPNTGLKHDYYNQINARIHKFPWLIHKMRIWNYAWIPVGQYSVIDHSSKSKKKPLDHTPCSATKEEKTNVTPIASNNRDITIISLSSLKPMNTLSLNHRCARVKHLKKKTKVKEPSNPSFTGSLQTTEHGEYNNTFSPRKKNKKSRKWLNPVWLWNGKKNKTFCLVKNSKARNNSSSASNKNMKFKRNERMQRTHMQKSDLWQKIR